MFLSPDQSNQRTFADPRTVDFYVHADTLQPPEATIAQLLAPELGTATMLDLGVGGGRTTRYFGPRVMRYVGVDYVPEMVTACRRRFAHEPYAIAQGDARDLVGFADRQFDLVLFSHNGLDCVSHEDRLRVLAEIHRVSREGAWLCFSSHNLGRAPDLLEGTRRGLGKLLDVLSTARIRANNPEYATWFARPHAMLRDGAFGFRLVSYHIRADAQIRQLHDAGFGDVRVFALTGGDELDRDAARRSREPWLYYLAKKQAPPQGLAA